MWTNEGQNYRTLVWQHIGMDKTLKSVLIDDMQFSMRLFYKLKRNKKVTVNGKKIFLHEMVKDGDLIQVFLEEEVSEYEPVEMDLKVLYEDDDVLLVQKPPYVVVHPTMGTTEPTLLNALLFYFRTHGIQSKVRFVNRLDRDTSGILIVAKNQYAHARLSKECGLWDMEKEYETIVKGHLEPEWGTLSYPIYKVEKEIKRIVDPKGQEATTHYMLKERFDDADLLHITLETGRTHQIRVHLSHIGHPIIGDVLYGVADDRIDRQALHCVKMSFFSPRKKDKITVVSSLPDDILNLRQDLIFGERL